jgi:hypothetical protein
LAIEEFGRNVLGKPVDVIFADHQNKPDVGANIARSGTISRVSMSSSMYRCPRSVSRFKHSRAAQQDVHYFCGRIR